MRNSRIMRDVDLGGERGGWKPYVIRSLWWLSMTRNSLPKTAAIKTGRRSDYVSVRSEGFNGKKDHHKSRTVHNHLGTTKLASCRSFRMLLAAELA